MYEINEIYESNKKFKKTLVYVFDISDDENYGYDEAFIIGLNSKSQNALNSIEKWHSINAHLFPWNDQENSITPSFSNYWW